MSTLLVPNFRNVFFKILLRFIKTHCLPHSQTASERGFGFRKTSGMLLSTHILRFPPVFPGSEIRGKNSAGRRPKILGDLEVFDVLKTLQKRVFWKQKCVFGWSISNFFRLRPFWSQSFNKKIYARKIIIVTLSETLKNEVFRAPQAKNF